MAIHVDQVVNKNKEGKGKGNTPVRAHNRVASPLFPFVVLFYVSLSIILPLSSIPVIYSRSHYKGNAAKELIDISERQRRQDPSRAAAMPDALLFKEEENNSICMLIRYASDSSAFGFNDCLHAMGDFIRATYIYIFMDG